jgi:acyl-CoA synthetase (AMP-forming)/AMP-acid ligase II
MGQPDSSVGFTTLVDLLQFRAASQPSQQGYTFLDDGESEGASLTYEELDRRARSLAFGLRASIEERGRVLLLFPPGLEFIIAFFGCLYSGLIPVPAYPPERGRLARALPLLKAIAGDVQPALILASARIAASLEQLLAEAPELGALDRLTFEDATSGAPELWKAPDVSGTTPALVQYTSGSTSSPKGVMLSHGNLLHNSALMGEAFGNSSASRGVIWLPPYHDMGLIGGILQALYAGCSVTLMSPVAFLLRPLRWLEAISRTRATISGGPNFAYDLCARRVSPAQRSGLDLSSWQIAFSGSEPIRFETIERFSDTFKSCGFRREAFYPCYGLAESTLFVTGGPKNTGVRLRKIDDGGEISAVGCGLVPPGQQVIIVDPEQRVEVRPAQIGEIWLSGPSVGLGYWNRPQETDAIFRARLADTGAGPFLRTGDLGFLQDNELFVTGRLKDLIIIGGRNHYPQDIEWTVEQSHPAFRSGCCAAFSVESNGAERLIIAVEIDRRFLSMAPGRESRFEITDALDPRGLVQAVRRAVTERHELRADRVLLLKPATLPKTTSGKIQRRACKSRFLEDRLETLLEPRL